jgi:hypothetical protein
VAGSAIWKYNTTISDQNGCTSSSLSPARPKSVDPLPGSLEPLRIPASAEKTARDTYQPKPRASVVMFVRAYTKVREYRYAINCCQRLASREGTIRLFSIRMGKAPIRAMRAGKKERRNIFHFPANVGTSISCSHTKSLLRRNIDSSADPQKQSSQLRRFAGSVSISCAAMG